MPPPHGARPHLHGQQLQHAQRRQQRLRPAAPQLVRLGQALRPRQQRQQLRAPHRSGSTLPARQALQRRSQVLQPQLPHAQRCQHLLQKAQGEEGSGA
jgi:hypothetical protein